MTDTSDGAFDATYAPLFRLWSDAGLAGALPSDQEIAAARALCGWGKFELSPGGAVKNAAGARMDLGGIAKGFGIDQAVEAMAEAGCAGGIVDVGGDLRVFGDKPDGTPWALAVRDPFGPGMIGIVHLEEGALCTSGNYERFSIIDGQRYSHIIDPRTGRPTDTNPSVSVIAPTAAVADAWATALSVLGPEGLALLPDGVDAMIVTGEPDDFQITWTDGFAARFTSDRPLPVPEDAP